MDYATDDMERELLKISSNECPNCGEPIDGNVCKKCGEKGLKEHFYDPDYEEYEKEIDKSNEEYFKGIEWEEVKDAD
jgi:predicted amidophosphoribosyltransferase